MQTRAWSPWLGILATCLLGACSSEDDPGEERSGPPEPTGPSGPPPLVVERLVPVEPSNAEAARRSRDNVSRPIWRSPEALEVHLTTSPDRHAILAVAHAPRPGEQSESKPKVPALSLRVHPAEGEPIDYPGKALAPEGTGDRPWYRSQVDLSQAPSGPARIEILVEGQPVSAGDPWLLSPPLLYQARDPNDEHLNVLIVTVDTLRADYLGCYGFPHGTTPNIDAFAERALRFERCIAQSGWTLPSYSSMLTGLYATHHTVVHRNNILVPSFQTFPEAFAVDGYTTGAVVSGTFTDNFWGFDQGFDSYDDLGMVTDDNQVIRSDFDPKEEMKSSELRITSQEVTDKALRWLGENRQHRFLFFAHYFDPHSDFVAHEGITEDIPNRPHQKRLPLHNRPEPNGKDPVALKRLYEGEVRYTDAQIGRLLDGLEELGLADSTVVVFCADHGEEFFERSQVGHGHGVFNELVHVPLAIRVPLPGFNPGRVAGTPVANVDLGPTLTELCDVPTPTLTAEAGRSLLPVLRDPQEDRGAPVLSVRFPTSVPKEALEQGIQRLPATAWRIDQGDETLIEMVVGRQRALYYFDSAEDPWQTTNLAQKRRNRVDPLRQLRIDLDGKLVERGEAVALGNVELNADMEDRLRRMGYLAEDEDAEIEEGSTPQDHEDGGPR